MRLQFLGTGGAFTDFRENYNNNAIIESSEGWVLIDCGVTAVQSMKELDVHPTEIQGLLLTHLHGDHAVPEQLIWERYYTSQKEGPSWMSTPIYAPPNILQPLSKSIQPFIGYFTNHNLEIVDNGVEVLIEEHHCQEGQIGDLKFKFYPVHHVQNAKVRKPAYGIEFTRKEQTVIWSGDTIFNEKWLIQMARREDVLCIFHECTFSPMYPGTVHCHWAQLKTLPKDVLGKIVIMHHNKVPKDIDTSGLYDHANRHQIFEF